MAQDSLWRSSRLEDLCEHITVGHVGPMVTEYVDTGVPFLRSQNVRPFRFDPLELKFISPEFHAKLKKSALRPMDVVVTRSGANTGQCCVIPESLNVANCSDLVILRPSDRLDPWFLMYILNSDWGRATIAGGVVGAAQHHFNIGIARKFAILAPPILEQRRIAAVLRGYDELIENSQRRIRILEVMAKSLYREWFVNFRFPGHDKVRRVPSAVGEVPHGWEIQHVPGCISVNPRVVVPREAEKPFLSMGCLSNDSMVIDDIESRTGNSGAKFQNGDTLFARITPCLENGKTGFVQFLPNSESVAFGSTEFIVLRSRTLTPEFVYLLSRSDSFRDNAIKSMSGASGRQRVQEKCFDSFKIAHPPRALLECFGRMIKPNFQLIQQLHLQIGTLRQTRDLLLPRLLSGQINLQAA